MLHFVSFSLTLTLIYVQCSVCRKLTQIDSKVFVLYGHQSKIHTIQYINISIYKVNQTTITTTNKMTQLQHQHYIDEKIPKKSHISTERINNV